MVNTMNRQMKKLTIAAAVSFLSIGNSYQVIAAPGVLAKTPLFVSTAVEPNVFLTVDDSGSMDWEVMIADGVAGFTADGGRPIIDGRYKMYWNPNWNDYDFPSNTRNRNVFPPATFSDYDIDNSESWDEDFWIMRNHNANKIYYNPDVTYSPWQGVDQSGNALYTNADPTNALRDPTRPGDDSVDLTAWHDYYDDIDCNCWLNGSYLIPSYYVWTDTDADGEIDASDDHQLIQIEPATTSYPSGRSYAEEIQNFANWFQYYRKREYAAKASIGGVINNTDASRMGLAVFNAGFIRDTETMSDTENKYELLDAFYTQPSQTSGTPARRSLRDVGNYFRGTGGSAPILPASQGGECQQNFNILMTDGFWNGFDPGVGNTDYSASADGGFDGDQTESNDGGNYEDNYANTLADVAMYYYENDLRGDLSDRVPPTPGVDEAEHQHLVTYGIGFGLQGRLDPAVDSPLDAGFSWPNPLDTEDEERIDDLWHAAYNSRGKYLSAQNPEELEFALNEAIADISERTATAAAASVTSARLTTESIVYVAEFNTNRWQGTIYAYGIANFDTGELNTTPEWSASAVLDARDISTNPRTILTYDNTADAGSVGDGVPFQWNDLTEAMKDDLRTNGAGGTDTDTVAEARLNYLRGLRIDEGQGNFFRERATLLGDIVNSGPVYVGKPDLRYPEGGDFPSGANAYSEFKQQQENRQGVVYVGANDGMLHGFHESTGEELLAYIPSNLFSTNPGEGLHYLTQQNYSHQFYNDLSPSVADIYINGSWKTVLISGQRSGGRGYYALDVTNPGAFSEANAGNIVMWEFTSDDDDDLGYTFSRPQIGMTNDGEWVAIFGNGYNHTGSSGEAKLFIVKISGGLDGSWDAGDYIEITTGSGSSANRNGLATPALADIDGDGKIDRAYAGDLNGQLWAFDLSGSTPASWGLAYGAGNPLFTTDGNQPITTKPILSFHPTEPSDGTNDPNVMVFFGSGQYLVEADKTTTNDDYFYGVWDKGTSNLTRSNLVEQTYRSGFTQRVLTQNAVDYAGGDFGWNISLPDSGERSVTNPAVRGKIVLFNSSVPTNDACSTGGYGYRFAVDIATGGTPDEPVLDVNKDGEIDSSDTIGADQDVQSADELTTLPTDNTFTEKVGYTGKDPFAITELKTPSTGRFSWQELLK